MHKFLRSIGYSKIDKKELEEILHSMSLQPDVIRVTKDSEGNEFAELFKEVGNNFGIIQRGCYREDESFQMFYYFPAKLGTSVTTEEMIEIEKHAEKESYAGVCDDNHLGVTLIFYLQTAADYLAEQSLKKYSYAPKGAMLAGLSVDGMILLPVKNSEKSKANKGKDRSKLIAEAKEGDEEAIEQLARDDSETYSLIGERIIREDVFSIVSTCFMPYGIESDQYMVIGNIQDFSLEKNRETGEEIYLLKIECNDIIFDICINKDDLLGEPAIGRRFRGSVWLQGCVCIE